MPKSRWILVGNLVAALLLAMSITMLTDFTHRLLTSDPDTLGIASVAVQALFTVVASSAFTSEGWSLLPNWLGKLLESDAGSAKLRLGLSAVLILIVAPTWFFLPPSLSQHYNARGFNLPTTAPGADAARDYRRAIALDPSQQYAYENLGVTFETFYRYDDAAEQYEKAIAATPSDPTPYSNLARVLLLDGKTANALQIANDGLALSSLTQSSLDEFREQSTDNRRIAFFASTDARNRQIASNKFKLYTADRDALYKNLAEAEFQLGFYSAAIKDAGQSKSAAAQCILGQVYAKLGKPDEAKKAWTNFNKLLQTPGSATARAQPGCSLLAEEQNEKH